MPRCLLGIYGPGEVPSRRKGGFTVSMMLCRRGRALPKGPLQTGGRTIEIGMPDGAGALVDS